MNSLRLLFEQERVAKDVNCRLLFDNNIGERNRTMKLMQQPFKEVPPRVYIKKTKNFHRSLIQVISGNNTPIVPHTTLNDLDDMNTFSKHPAILCIAFLKSLFAFLSLCIQYTF
jgi:hypothetical protein